MDELQKRLAELQAKADRLRIEQGEHIEPIRKSLLSVAIMLEEIERSLNDFETTRRKW